MSSGKKARPYYEVSCIEKKHGAYDPEIRGNRVRVSTPRNKKHKFGGCPRCRKDRIKALAS